MRNKLRFRMVSAGFQQLLAQQQFEPAVLEKVRDFINSRDNSNVTNPWSYRVPETQTILNVFSSNFYKNRCDIGSLKCLPVSPFSFRSKTLYKYRK